MPRLRAAAACALLVAVLGAAGSTMQSQSSAPGASAAVVVRELVPASADAERLVRRLGGDVTLHLPIVGGFAAELPARAVPALERSGLVVDVSPDAAVSMSEDDDDDLDVTRYDTLPPNGVWRAAVGLDDVDLDGEDVAVAVLDTGVSQVGELSDNVKARVEFTPGHDGIDRFGHGTHIAGIIAGGGGDDDDSGRGWQGVAPEAELISIKVAGPDGATDVSVVIAALQWVVANRDRFGIRVLNLSFGTDAKRSYLADPLDAAVERVWRAGILVVAAAGNSGPDAETVAKPADDPFVLSVGAADLRGTVDRGDDVVAPFSSRGPTADGVAKPEVVAPGMSIVSLRARGSSADLDRPDARVGSSHFKGTGTSQAAAVVSGIAALLFEADSSLTPDEAKAALVGSSGGLSGQAGAGNGLVDASRALAAVRDNTYSGVKINAPHLPASGAGPIEPSRGSSHVYSDPDGDGVPQLLTGEVDALGKPWSFGPWSSRSGWTSSPWKPLVGEFQGWEIRPWTGPTWSGMVSDGQLWSARHWSNSGWVARHWSARHWSAGVWN